MRKPGLEPGRVSPQDPKSCASTSSATFAWLQGKVGVRRRLAGPKFHGKDVRGQNTEFRIQTKTTGSHWRLPVVYLNSEFCILTSDVFAVPTISLPPPEDSLPDPEAHCQIG